MKAPSHKKRGQLRIDVRWRNWLRMLRANGIESNGNKDRVEALTDVIVRDRPHLNVEKVRSLVFSLREAAQAYEWCD